MCWKSTKGRIRKDIAGVSIQTYFKVGYISDHILNCPDSDYPRAGLPNPKFNNCVRMTSLSLRFFEPHTSNHRTNSRLLHTILRPTDGGHELRTQGSDARTIVNVSTTTNTQLQHGGRLITLKIKNCNPLPETTVWRQSTDSLTNSLRQCRAQV
jgi:hypothetical protein